MLQVSQELQQAEAQASRASTRPAFGPGFQRRQGPCRGPCPCGSHTCRPARLAFPTPPAKARCGTRMQRGGSPGSWVAPRGVSSLAEMAEGVVIAGAQVACARAQPHLPSRRHNSLARPFPVGQLCGARRHRRHQPNVAFVACVCRVAVSARSASHASPRVRRRCAAVHTAHSGGLLRPAALRPRRTTLLAGLAARAASPSSHAPQAAAPPSMQHARLIGVTACVSDTAV